MTDIPAFSLRLKLVICPSTTLPGATVPNPSDIWFPVPNGVLTLPALPPEQTNPETIPPNSASVGECFDPDNVDISQIFTNLLPQTSTPGVYERTLDTDVLLLPRNEIIPIRGVTRLVFGLIVSKYDLTPKFTDISLSLKIVGEFLDLAHKITPDTGAFVLTGQEAQRRKVFVASSASFIFTGQASDLTYTASPVKLIAADTGTFKCNKATPATVLSSFDTALVDDANSIDWYWLGASKPSIVPTAKYGTGSVSFPEFNNTQLHFVLDDAQAPPPGSDFTMECWHNAGLGGNPDSRRPIFSLTNTDTDNTQYTYILYYDQGEIFFIEFDPSSYVWVREFYHPAVVDNNEWVHLALEYYQGELYFYVNGVRFFGSITPAYSIDLQKRVYLGGAGIVLYPYEYGRGLYDDFRLLTYAEYKGKSFDPPTQAHTVSGTTSGDAVLSLRTGLSATAAGFALTGQSASFKTAKFLIASTAAFNLNGQAALFSRPAKTIAASTGLYTLTGGQAYDYPTYVGFQAATSTTGTATIGFNLSGNPPAIGDLALLFVETSAGFGNANFGPMPKPAGWNDIPGLPIGNTGTGTSGSFLSGFWQILTATNQGDVALNSTANHMVARLIVLRGIDTAIPILSYAVSQNSVPGVNMTWPQLNAVGYRNVVVEVATLDYDTNIVSVSGYNTNSSNKIVTQTITTSVNSGDGGGLFIKIMNTPQPGLLPASTATATYDMQHCYSMIQIGSLHTASVNLALPANAGALVLSGQSSVLRKSSILAAGGGTYTLTGSDVYLGAPPIIFPAAGGDYTLTGQAAGSAYTRGIAAAGGEFTAAGQEALLGEPDAVAYIAAVQVADSQALEPEVANAYSKFIWGCKSDGIWTAIKASCIMAGARTLAGALTPLVGPAPTNNNFVAGDYSRTAGLVGNGSTKYLNSNRANNADPQNNQHMSAFINSGNVEGAIIGAGDVVTGATHILPNPAASRMLFRNRNSLNDDVAGQAGATGLVGMTRTSSTAFTARCSSSNTTFTRTSQTPASGNVFVFARSATNKTPARLSFYSIGESIDLALLDSRVTTLMADIAAAIP